MESTPNNLVVRHILLIAIAKESCLDAPDFTIPRGVFFSIVGEMIGLVANRRRGAVCSWQLDDLGVLANVRFAQNRTLPQCGFGPCG
jgi:hypothetical protein